MLIFGCKDEGPVDFWRACGIIYLMKGNKNKKNSKKLKKSEILGLVLEMARNRMRRGVSKKSDSNLL